MMFVFTVTCLLLSPLVQFEAFFTSSTRHLCHYDESIALLQFKNEMIDLKSFAASALCEDSDQNMHPKMTSWNKTTSDCCTWDGVKCHEITGHIVGLDLSCGMLTGVIHQNSSLYQLSHLQKLNLAKNNFSFSKVSPNIGGLSRLVHLNFSDSCFEGIIPPHISHLSKLILLDLSFSENLYFSPNHFHNFLRNLSRVRILSLNNVNILTNLQENWSSSSLTCLDLQFTKLWGKLPKSIFLLPRLRKLLLTGNRNLSVSLPKSNLSNASFLKVLQLSYTDFDADGFTNSVNSFALLTFLGLSDCKLSGSFPKSIANLSRLSELDLSLNEFTGAFPTIIFNLPAKLVKIDLNWNYFTGQFPSNIGNLTELRLKVNSLKGPLPLNMREFSKLRTLDLSSNAFDGQIPSWLLSSPWITYLDLSNNCLTGQIREFTAKSLVKLDLSSNKLNGRTDFKVFRQVNKLQQLKLSYNKLSFKLENKINVSFPKLSILGLSSCQITEFPSFLIQPKNLVYLDLSNNKLIGKISYMIPLYPLHYLNLSHNSLTGLGSFNSLRESIKTFPIIKNLEVLDLSSNKFKEPLSLFICTLKSLYILDLSHNNFLGTIPECYGGFSSNLQVLNLEKNDLEGIISLDFSKHNSLLYLNLKGNSFQGTLPESLGNCKKLRVLDVGNNVIKDTFPKLGNFTHLQVLILKSNRFFGSIRNVKNEYFFPKLQVFDLSCNEFNGAVPAELLKSFRTMMASVKIEVAASRWNSENDYYRYPISISMKGGILPFTGILTTVVAIDLSSNLFIGEIPEIIGNLYSLVVLNLSHNNFSGSIPSTLGKLNFLESLDLAFNLFVGIIPSQLADVTFLEILNLSHNRLSGRIPEGKQFNTFLSDSYSGNLGLCGHPLTINCAERNLSLRPVQASIIHDDDKDSCFFCTLNWKALVIGGVFGIYLDIFYFFLLRKPRLLGRND